MEYFKSDDLKPILFSQYNPEDFESPIQSLEDFFQCRSSMSSQSTADFITLDNPKTKYQSVESFHSNLLPYQCHIKSKKEFPHLENNENNVIIASWHFHQYFDGLHVSAGFPMIAIRPISVGNPIQMEDCPSEVRSQVDIVIECFSDEVAKVIKGWLKLGSDVSSDTLKTWVYVKDAEMFCDCLNWKYEDNKKMW